MTVLIARTTATPLSKQASTAATHDCYKHNNYSYPRWWGGGVWRVAPWEGKESATNRAPPSSVSQRLGHTWQPVSCLLSNTSRHCILLLGVLDVASKGQTQSACIRKSVKHSKQQRLTPIISLLQNYRIFHRGNWSYTHGALSGRHQSVPANNPRGYVMVINIIITRPKLPYMRQGLAGEILVP